MVFRVGIIQRLSRKLRPVVRQKPGLLYNQQDTEGLRNIVTRMNSGRRSKY